MVVFVFVKIGGIHDMASWTAEIWMHVAKLIEEGTDACNIPRNTLFITCHNKTESFDGRPNMQTIKNPGRLYPLNLHNLTRHDILRKRAGRGLQLYPGIELLSLLETEKLTTLREKKGQGEPKDDQPISLESKQPYSEAGRFGFSCFVFLRLLSKFRLLFG